MYPKRHGKRRDLMRFDGCIAEEFIEIRTSAGMRAAAVAFGDCKKRKKLDRTL
jgi:hypothetical protein